MSGSTSWSSKLCARCGTARTSNVSDGQPICSPCLQERRALAASKDQPPRPCPVDGAVMEPRYLQGVVVDRCPTCRGVFLDKGELEVLVRVLAPGGASDSAHAEWLDGLLQGAIGGLF